MMDKFNELPDAVKNQLIGFKEDIEVYRNTNPKDEDEIIYFDTKKGEIVGLFIDHFGFIPSSSYFNILRYLGFNEEDSEEFYRFIIVPLLDLKKYYNNPNSRVRLVGGEDTFDKYKKRFKRNTENGYIIKI